MKKVFIIAVAAAFCLPFTSGEAGAGFGCALQSGFGGPGLFDTLAAGLGALLFIRFRRPRKGSDPAPPERPNARSDPFLKDLKRADSAFDADDFRKKASNLFVRVQKAWKKRDLEPIRKYLAEDLFYGMANELEKAIAAGRVSHIEKVSVRETAITEAWQEEGLDYVTVRISVEATANTTDRDGSPSGEGPKTVAFTEYWTFVREVWLGDWKLTGIERERG